MRLSPECPTTDRLAVIVLVIVLVVIVVVVVIVAAIVRVVVVVAVVVVVGKQLLENGKTSLKITNTQLFMTEQPYLYCRHAKLDPVHHCR